MQVKINKSAPVVTPPTTYDLLGLTEGEVRALRALLGANTIRHAADRGYVERDAARLYDALFATGVKYTTGYGQTY